MLGVWCLGGEKMWESKGNIYISYFGMFSNYIHDFEFFFFFFLLGVWMLRKCGKVKRNSFFFFFGL